MPEPQVSTFLDESSFFRATQIHSDEPQNGDYSVNRRCRLLGYGEALGISEQDPDGFTSSLREDEIALVLREHHYRERARIRGRRLHQIGNDGLQI